MSAKVDTNNTATKVDNDNTETKVDNDNTATKGKKPPNNVETEMTKSWYDRNSIINIACLAFTFYGLILGPWYFALTWPLVLLIDDFLLFYFGTDTIFDTEIGIQRGYQFGHVFIDNTSGDGRDLGFNLYEGDLSKTYDKSQTDKWDHMIKVLNLKPGDSLCDVGCGYGDWLNYAKSKGIKVAGINITPEQADYANREYGVNVACTNWKDVLVKQELRDMFYNKFDAITFMDTIEHYVSSKYRKNEEMQAKIYSDMFLMAKNMLKNDGKNGTVFISCLHQNDKVAKKWPLKIKLWSYFLTRYHSGFYPWGKDGLTKWSAKWFNLVDQVDKTEDYRITAVLDDYQFQAPRIRYSWRKFGRSVLLFFLDPHHLHKWIDIYTDSWMNLYGEDAYSTEYNPKQRQKTSFVILWWITLRLKSSQLKDKVKA